MTSIDKKIVMQYLSIEAKIEELARVRRFIENTVQPFGIQERQLSDIRLAVDELLTNTIVHGYGSKAGTIDIILSYDPENHMLTIVLRDDAQLFDPFTKLANHNTAERLSQVEPGGFGLRLIQQSMNETQHKVTKSGGNELTLIKHLCA